MSTWFWSFGVNFRKRCQHQSPSVASPLQENSGQASIGGRVRSPGPTLCRRSISFLIVSALDLNSSRVQSPPRSTYSSSSGERSVGAESRALLQLANSTVRVHLCRLSGSTGELSVVSESTDDSGERRTQRTHCVTHNSKEAIRLSQTAANPSRLSLRENPFGRIPLGVSRFLADFPR